jgi:hypothetical protein
MGEVIEMLRDRLEAEQEGLAQLEQARRQYQREHPGEVDVVTFWIGPPGNVMYIGPRIVKKRQEPIR